MSLNALFTIPLVRNYASIVQIIYDATVGQVWRETSQALKDKKRDLTLPNSPYKTYRSGYSLSRGKESSAYWINDRELIFNGRALSALPNAKPLIPDILIWDIEKGVRVFKKHAWLNCFWQGKILFNEGTVDSYQYGPLESQRNIAYSEAPTSDRGECDNSYYRLSTKAKNVASRQLRDGDGWLEFSKSSEASPYILHHKENGEIVRLDLGITNEPHVYGRFHVQYSAFNQAYFFYSDYMVNETGTNWPLTLNRTMWWFYPAENRVEKAVVPAPWGTAYSFHPTARGILFSSVDFNASKRSHQVFLINGEVVTPLFAKDTSAVGVLASPKGCRVAMAVSDERNGGGLSLYAIDLCLAADGEKNAR